MYTYFLSCQKLDKKVDTALIPRPIMIKMKLQLGHNKLSFLKGNFKL